jgi:hypothetical protein
VHEPALGIEPPVKVTFELPAVAVIVPPQVLLALPETRTPVGSESMSGAVKVATTRPELCRVMVRREIPSALIVAGLKALSSVGVTGEGTAHAAGLTALSSNVTAPLRANALPDILVPVLSVMLVSARIFPTKVEFVPSVAELPTCQESLHC